MTRRRFSAGILVCLLAALSGGGAFAVCNELGGYAIFQCSDLAFFATPPVTPTFSPQNRVLNINAIYWQIGFGNNASNPGAGSTGTGNAGPTNFNGNDLGLAIADVGNAKAITGNNLIPTGALCLVNNNWGNSGIDGCCDNDRGTSITPNNDDILNPLYDVYYSRSGYPGIYSRTWVQDYPMAVLLSTQDSRWFAAAAVATVNRGSTGPTNGPCADPPGTNPAPCDFRVGFYPFKAITNGEINPVNGLRNVIPWQEVPRPRPACVANCVGTSTRIVNFQWSPSILHHDASIRLSDHPQMAPADATRATGVGVKDLLTRENAGNNWHGLVRYDLEYAFVGPGNVDPNGRVNFATLVFQTDPNQAGTIDVPQNSIDPSTGNPNPLTPVTVTGVVVPSDTCWRVRVKFGKKPETTATATANCRLGKCGDIGYNMATASAANITCVGGALFTEAFDSASASRESGKVVVDWTFANELSVVGYNVYAINGKGVETLATASPLPCTECSTGASATYRYVVPAGVAKGGLKAVLVEALASVPVRTDPLPIR